MSVHPIHLGSATPRFPMPRLQQNLAVDPSGFLFDLDYADDLAPYLVGHRRLKQIREHPPLLLYANPVHCDGDAILSRIRRSLHGYPRLVDHVHDDIGQLGLQLSQLGHLSEPDGSFESHRMVMFSSGDPIDPIGFLVLERRIAAEAQAQRIGLRFRVASIYVMPEHRGLGYGTALCVGAGVCCGWEIRHQLERYRPYAVTLSPGLDTTVLIQQHPRLTHAMEGRIAAMMDRNMEAPLARCNACLEVLHR